MELYDFCNPYLQRLPDILHHFELGVIKLYVFCVVEHLKAVSKEKIEEFDNAFRKLGKIPNLKVYFPLLFHYWLRKMVFNKKFFQNGVSHLSYLKAWEYRELLLQLPCIFFEIDAPSEIQMPCFHLIDILVILRRKEFSVPSSLL